VVFGKCLLLQAFFVFVSGFIMLYNGFKWGYVVKTVHNLSG